MKGFAEVGVIEVFNGTPETVVRVSAFGKKAVDMGIPFKGTTERMKDTNKTGNKIFSLVQGEKEFLDDIRNSLKEAVKQRTVFKEKAAERFINGEDQVPVCTVDQLKGHGSSPVVRIFRSASGAEFGMAAKRNKLKITALWTAIHGTAIRGVSTVDYFFDVIQYNRSWF